MTSFKFAPRRYAELQLGPLPELLARDEFPPHIEPETKLIGVTEGDAVLQLDGEIVL